MKNEDNIYKGSSNFWKKFSERNDLSLNSLMNLEVEESVSKEKFEYEKKKLESIIDYDKNAHLLDLGGGIGLWSEYFSNYFKHVTLVERETEFVKIAQKRLKNKNIDIVISDVVKYESEKQKYDIVFISGVTIYLNDKNFLILLSRIKKYLKTNGLLVHRDAYGINKRFLLDNINSSNLQENYSAVYRTRKEYDEIFINKYNFLKLYDEDMYKEKSNLNKRKETKLRISVYKNI